MGRRRLGVALLIPEPARTEIEGLRRALGDPALERIPPHITLVPPVNVREDDLVRAVDVMRRAAAATKPFELTLGPPDSFLPHNPVVYLGVWGFLDRLGALRDRVFVEPLKRELTWPFVPHVTVADGIAPERVEAGVAVLGDYTRDVVVESVHLLQEKVHEHGERRWHLLGDFPFGLPRIVGRGGLELELTVSHRLDDVTRAWVGERWPDPQSPLAVTARRDGDVVGIATGWTDGELANLSELFVSANARNEGVGGHLVTSFVTAAIERGARRCRLRTASGSPAESFYRSRGWREEGVFPGASASTRIVQLVRDL